ncbi:MAG: fumarylacetoacetate hydrolase family protein [Candidatus Acidiferrales bacterium]|jgi:2-keto-4-pentenoate hydratase/2-oxohepta-3-ene-1,7-dioic acid hydratase in catechol pathway
MKQNRRNFMKGTGAVCASALTSRLPTGLTAAAFSAREARGMARGLTLLTIRRGTECRLGVKDEKGILDVVEAAKILQMRAPATIDDLLQNEDGPSLNALVNAAAKSKAAQRAFLKEDTIEFGPVVTHPEKIICVGLNYRQHAIEIGAPIPKQPVLFNKYNTTLNHHNGTIKLPVDFAKKFDYEVELVMAIGREAKAVNEADALSYVAGYATGNDFTARDLQLETGGQWMVGKTPDQFAPIGPYLVTADQIIPDNLKLECRVNGETRQSSNTSDFIFDTRKMISYISRVITLKPGDIVFTGTPQGVIQGKPKDQQVWLKAGDKIACSVERLGELKFELV